jgi:predicted dehydrogenase/flavin reductase (DIM6/NTAB) family NADH-FMN oxidoreductase RutF
MLLSNETIWDARLQVIDAVLTASAAGRNEAYFLATVSQVGLDPPLISVSPNPEYPVCEAIAASGYFAVNFPAAAQRDLVPRLIALEKPEPDKLAALGLAYERTANGTPLLRDCLQAIECRVEEAWDSGDHRTIVGRVTERRIREAFRGNAPLRFDAQPAGRALVKRLLCRTRVYDLMALGKGLVRPPLSIRQGTLAYMGLPAGPPVPGRRRAASPPGVCLVGCGWWGRVHGLALRELGPKVRRFFASRDIAAARDFARRFSGEDAFEGLDAALADPRVDAVVLALPHHLHARAALAALEAGKHVLVEKPLTTDAGDARALIDRADAAGLCLAVAEQYPLSPLVLAAKAAIDDGEVGRVALVRCGVATYFRPGESSWKTDREAAGGGVLLDVGIHYVAILRRWFGEPTRVEAVVTPGGPAGFGAEDTVAVALGFRDGPAALLHVSWSAAGQPDLPNIEVLGERGSLQLWFDRPDLLLTAPLPDRHWAQRARRKLPWRVASRIDRHLPDRRRRRIRVRSTDLVGSRAIVDDFVEAIVNGREPSTPGRDGLRDLEVVLAAYRSTGET